MDERSIDATRQALQEEIARFEQRRGSEFPPLPALPSARYSDPTLHQLELEHLWTKTWVLAGHVGELPEPGSYKLWEGLGVPILLVRSEDQQIRAFYNVCRHRSGSLVEAPCGKLRKFVCTFHSWTYGLDGQLSGVPMAHDFPGLDKSAMSLLPVRCELWGTLIFVNRDPNAAPFLEHLGERLRRECADYDLDQRVVYHVQHYEVECNWKLLYDAFIEDYHGPRVHANTAAPAIRVGGNLINLLRNGHGRMVSKMRMDDAEQMSNPMFKAASKRDPRHDLGREAFVSYSVFPNLVGSWAESEFALLTMWPASPTSCTSDVYFLTRPGEDGSIDDARCQQFIAEFSVITDEDIDNLRRMAKGLHSGVVKEHTLGFMERRIHQVHEQIDRLIGPEKIPPHLRVRSSIAEYCE